MKVYELIEYLKTLNQDYEIMTGDSEYPNEGISEDSFTKYDDKKEYVIY